jgi:hypothetical protein
VTAPLRKDGDPLGRFIAEINEIRRIATQGTSMPFRIPVVNEDPSESDPTNLWLFPDGRMRGRHLNTAGTAYVYREWATGTPGSDTSATAPAAPTAPIVTQEDSWPAIWSQSYRQSGAARTDLGVTHLYYGSSGDAFNGRNQSLIGFDHASIASALSGSTVNSVRLSMTNVHAWYNSGVQIYFGIHNYSSEPATWAGGGIPRQRITNHHFGKPQFREVWMPLEFATAIRDGWGKGVALEAPSSSREFYGYAAGVGSGYAPPVLTVNYSK